MKLFRNGNGFKLLVRTGSEVLKCRVKLFSFWYADTLNKSKRLLSFNWVTEQFHNKLTHLLINYATALRILSAVLSSDRLSKQSLSHYFGWQ